MNSTAGHPQVREAQDNAAAMYRSAIWQSRCGEFPPYRSAPRRAVLAQRTAAHIADNARTLYATVAPRYDDAVAMADELVRMGYGDVLVDDGHDLFDGDQWETIAATVGVRDPNIATLDLVVATVAARLS